MGRGRRKGGSRRGGRWFVLCGAIRVCGGGFLGGGFFALLFFSDAPPKKKFPREIATQQEMDDDENARLAASAPPVSGNAAFTNSVLEPPPAYLATTWPGFGMGLRSTAVDDDSLLASWTLLEAAHSSDGNMGDDYSDGRAHDTWVGPVDLAQSCTSEALDEAPAEALDTSSLSASVDTLRRVLQTQGVAPPEVVVAVQSLLTLVETRVRREQAFKAQCLAALLAPRLATRVNSPATTRGYDSAANDLMVQIGIGLPCWNAAACCIQRTSTGARRRKYENRTLFV